MIISVKAHPKSKQSKVKSLGEASFEVWVREAPDRGRANEAVIEAMSEHLDVPKSRFTIISGAAAKNKRLEIR